MLRNGEKICQAFEPTLTDAGICYVYNARKIQEIFRASEYVDLMSRNLFEGNTTVINPVGAGDSFKLVVGLDIQSSK